MALVDRRKCRGKVAPVKRLHDRCCSLPAVGMDDVSHRFECSQMLLRVEAIASWAPLCFRDQATGLVIAYLLDTDVSSQCEIAGTQIETICHVKLPSALRDFFQWMPFFLPHRTSILSLSRSRCAQTHVQHATETLQLGIGVVQ